MKAAVIREYGSGAAGVQIEEWPMPEIGAGEALVRVRAVAFNRLDMSLLDGTSAWLPPLPHIGGSEIAGEIVQLDEAVRGFSIGQPVVIAPYSPQPDRDADETDPAGVQLAGYHYFGGQAEYLKVPGAALLAMPDELPFAEAAAQTLTTLTAWHALVSQAGVRPGEWVLIPGASGGVGTAAIQIAKLWGAQVIAASRNPAHLAKAEELGADFVINYAEEDMAARVREITRQHGADTILEHIGRDTWPASLKAVARNGRIVVCGASSGGAVELDLGWLSSREVLLIGAGSGSKEELKEVLRLTADSRLSAVIDSTYPLDDLASAYHRLASRQQFGKIVLAVVSGQ